MAPVKFAHACAGVHLLMFDRRFNEARRMTDRTLCMLSLVKRFAEYIAAHPGELRETQDPYRNLTGKPSPPRRARSRPLSGWAEKAAVAEELLWHKRARSAIR